ncbi:PREDICTED: serine/threonine-protein kinase ppk15 [Tarenaya hassleriana]|uniref:serine/threonine-protein kinase ppk15 n=1 Tax=Tarenaya hassleriana TaxID=28532 RepID=UPI00053C494F|nr:PREDICTED: serine/threonine-protein kinase ppk15 [Tarenaya hassleriana]XP_010528679.1 PREDICTED: serine/threonine-protein kinase ppk15 [Tarenaya hassleriana]XP_010528680.1 PREDICTED: serine/threonine-protein kinase ppk15 [Tarenaya hassleriana]XP_010528682.1 PREDICTED: serine/threonine-protein kinase ppk15 [Tarenaya hassleriana]
MDDVGSSDGGVSRAREMCSQGAPTPWEPMQLDFRRYVSPRESMSLPKPLRVAVKKSLVVKLTRDIVETYKICNPQFKYSGESNPKRYLTSPSVGVLNDGFDNSNSDLILGVNDVLASSDSQQRYIVKDLLGHGTFGQVAKCWVPATNSYVAVKIIKNQPAYYQQALVEVSILTTLNKKYDPEDNNHIVRIYDYFLHQRHLCICFELLDMNLYELIKINQFRGLSLSIVQLFSKQILRGLALLKDAGIIHCDLKPENILLCTSVKPAGIKIIDFGSACMEDRTVYSYIQSRYYRSPEVLLGYQYATAIDMWSFGCIVAELFLGLPLFPGASEFDLLSRMIEILGEQPPDYVLKDAKNMNKFFKCVGSVHNLANGEISGGIKSAYMALTEEEFETREKKKPAIGKDYFNHKNLEAIVKSYPYRKNLLEEDIVKETQVRLALIDFLRGLVEFDPAKRWSPFQASKHPFVTGEPFTCPYKPPPETPRVHVAQNIRVDHHPGGGHWFAAGLSPHVSGIPRVSMHNSPHFQTMPYSQANSYGSIGNYGSYNDGTRLGGSYGSYGESSNMFAYYSPVSHSGMNIHNRGGISMIGSSPDARRRIMQYPHGTGLGVSPSAGNFAPLPLGTSPSQFTPPSSTNQFLAGSPGHYGPTSPVRGSCHGSPLGKMPAFSQFNRRKSLGHCGSSQSQDSSLSQPHVQGMNNSFQIEGNTVTVGSPSHLQLNSGAKDRTHTRGCATLSDGYSTQNTAGSTLGANVYVSSSIGPSHENPDGDLSVPDPRDWDPNYSDELLLQEDSIDDSSIVQAFGRGLHIGSSGASTSSGRFNNNASTSSSNLATQRRYAPNQAFSQAEIGSNPTHDPRARLAPFIPMSHYGSHVPQNSPSRLGQQTAPRFNHGRPNGVRGSDWNHMKAQLPPSSSSSGGPRSPRSSSFTNGIPWGRRANHHVTNVPSTSHGKMDYGSIA